MRRPKIKYTPKLTSSRRSDDQAIVETENAVKIVDSPSALQPLSREANLVNQDGSQKINTSQKHSILSSPPLLKSSSSNISKIPFSQSPELTSSNSNFQPSISSASQTTLNTPSSTIISAPIKKNATKSNFPKATTLIVKVPMTSGKDEELNTKIDNTNQTTSTDSSNVLNTQEVEILSPVSLNNPPDVNKEQPKSSLSSSTQVAATISNTLSDKSLLENEKARSTLRNGNIRPAKSTIKASQPLKSVTLEGPLTCKNGIQSEATVFGKNLDNKPKKRLRISSKDLIHRSKLTMYDLIHNPISTKRRGRKKKIPQESGESSSSDDDNSSVRTRSSDKEKINKPVQDDSSTMSNDTPTTSLSKEANNSVTPSQEDDLSSNKLQLQPAGPRVKVGPDGQIILDEESLVIKKPKEIQETVIGTSTNGKVTYSSFRKKSRCNRWNKEETLKFYTALNLIGPDFSLMAKLFFKGIRSRRDLKNKFRRENKLNKSVIENALYDVVTDYGLAQEAFEGKVTT